MPLMAKAAAVRGGVVRAKSAQSPIAHDEKKPPGKARRLCRTAGA